MTKKMKDYMERHAIAAAVIVFVLLELVLFALGRVFRLFPQTMVVKYVKEIVLIVVPIAIVCFFGFSRAFKKGNFFRGLICALPIVLWQGFVLWRNLATPEANWQTWDGIVYGLVTMIGIGIREEGLYRATIQNILAKKYANSVKGIWITVVISSILFGLCHVSNLFAGMNPLAVFTQVSSAAVIGLVLGAVYLRSGSLWAVVLIHSLIDTASLASEIFMDKNEMDVANRLAWNWQSLLFYLVLVAFAAFLLRPSKCKQICQSLCFAEEK